MCAHAPDSATYGMVYTHATYPACFDCILLLMMAYSWYCIEGNFGDGKFGKCSSYINIFGKIKFGEVVKPVRASAHLCSFIIYRQISGAILMYGQKVWSWHGDVHGICTTINNRWPMQTGTWSIICHFQHIRNSLWWPQSWHRLTCHLGWATEEHANNIFKSSCLIKGHCNCNCTLML